MHSQRRDTKGKNQNPKHKKQAKRCSLVCPYVKKTMCYWYDKIEEEIACYELIICVWVYIFLLCAVCDLFLIFYVLLLMLRLVTSSYGKNTNDFKWLSKWLVTICSFYYHNWLHSDFSTSFSFSFFFCCGCFLILKFLFFNYLCWWCVFTWLSRYKLLIFFDDLIIT